MNIRDSNKDPASDSKNSLISNFKIYTDNFSSVKKSTSPIFNAWNSLVVSMKKVGISRNIYVSTFFGSPYAKNDPVIGICLERLCSYTDKNRVKSKNSVKRDKELSSSFNKLINQELEFDSANDDHNELDFYNPSLSHRYNSSSSSNTKKRGNYKNYWYTSYLDFDKNLAKGNILPNLTNVLLVTESFIQHYSLNGNLLNTLKLHEKVTTCIPATIAGTGRILICGTANGLVYLMNREEFNKIFIFDIVCYDKKFLKLLSLYKKKLVFSLNRSDQNTQSSKVDKKNRIKVFQDDSLFIANIIIKIVNDYIQAHSNVDTPFKNKTVVYSRCFKDILKKLGCTGTLNGNGVTLSLLKSYCDRVIHNYNFSESSNLLESIPKILNNISHDTTLLIAPSNKTNAQDDEEYEHNQSVSSLNNSNLNHNRLCEAILQIFRDLVTSPRRVTSITTKTGFGNICETIIAGTSDGEIFIWEVPSGILVNVISYPEESQVIVNDPFLFQDIDQSCHNGELIRDIYSKSNGNNSVLCLQLLHIGGADYQLWVGHQNGLLCIYNLNNGQFVKCIIDTLMNPITWIEVTPALRVSLILVGNTNVYVVNCEDFAVIKMFSDKTLSVGNVISCIRTTECLNRYNGRPVVCLFLGCLNGSIFVGIIYWDDQIEINEEQNDNMKPKKTLIQNQTSGETLSTKYLKSDMISWYNVNRGMPFTSCNSIEGIPSLNFQKDFVLQFRLIKSYNRKLDIPAAITYLSIDSFLDTLFIGDSNGTIATILPIRHLLEVKIN